MPSSCFHQAKDETLPTRTNNPCHSLGESLKDIDDATRLTKLKTLQVRIIDFAV